MKKKKLYHILIDYGYEGMNFWDAGHTSLAEAVREAVANNYGHKFYIVKIVDWEPKEES